MSGDGGVLAVPEGLIVAEASRRRLQRQLARAEPACAGVAAEVAELAPGASYRVCAERRARAPETEIVPGAALSVHGAALLRPGVGFEIDGEVVTVERGALVLDPGASVHDPWGVRGALDDASPLGRPLAQRPVALFLGLEPDPYVADWVRGLVNGLVRGDVEGRIAVPAPTGGLHLTRPCAPTEASVRALAPSVVVALDDAAATQVRAWLRGRRCALVLLTPDTSAAVDVATSSRRAWRRGRRRRPEATIGRGVGPDTMRSLVRRLGCAAPPEG